MGPQFPRGWAVEGGDRRASVEVETRDFLHAVDIVRRIAQVAERLEHHPDIHLERYNRLRIETWSHDVGHLTKRDERLAREVQALLDAEGLGRD
jgi:4a-hydroxytetrahydrobiopterin dehydratase